MRETGSNGKTAVFMPKDRIAAVNKLASLSSLAAAREWERAAMIALLVKRGTPGRKRTNIRANGDEPYSIKEFTRLGIYGFRSEDSIRAYMKAWESSGLETPAWGDRIELPSTEFPDVPALYGRVALDTPEPTLDPPEDSGTEDYADDSSDVEDVPPHTGNGRERAKPVESTMLDQFLRVLDRTDPVHVLLGQPADKRELLIKTLESWLDSLREAAGDASD